MLPRGEIINSEHHSSPDQGIQGCVQEKTSETYRQSSAIAG